MQGLIPRPRSEVAPGAVHVPDWLDLTRQRELLEACREWSRPPGALRSARLPSGGVMSVRSVCLGWHWYPYQYSRTVDDGDGREVAPFPRWLADWGQAAVTAAYGAETDHRPDIALINYYDSTARMGMHQDRDERSDAPVVSLSLGTACVFRFGNTDNRGKPYTDVQLHSGDLFVFGGPSRYAYHGVPRTLPESTEPGLGLRTGRLNVTLRVSGMA
ncbi:alpha-ketoglutarate-dependent dioxygenase AlkB [Allosaccharopolyspora coralli]|uniref:Alpha-ketoglutarate-dependent dioxygenase AlkB n=1 Tax=Allosaccharopolyspora coralli TaxID=2665642 RepID=A0A5Q3QLJ2_9PSEU|nr:alpha-ketoglutarate-dependent dioxygenase AlkB [Allosaccharopolyspora coralli]QGK72289.1 alpha-ketoglutarate-dependent dioxygenase AlkB [Allosaccharopolyspora coralli]